jgi:hypothetical protein
VPPGCREPRHRPERKIGSCLEPPPGGSAEPITLGDKLARVWKHLLTARY